MVLLSISASTNVLESMARADMLIKRRFRNDDSVKRKFGYEALAVSSEPEQASDQSYKNTTQEGVIVGERKFEITELCDLFLGSRLRVVYIISIAMYMYGLLWVYSAVFAKALSAHFPVPFSGLEEYSYLVYLCIFAAIVLPISCLELSEQIHVQLVLSVCRIVMLVLMVSTLTPAIWGIEYSSLFECQGDPSRESRGGERLFCVDEIYHILPIAAYAFIFHHSIPSLAEPVANKHCLARVYGVTLLLAFVGYATMGWILASYFKDDIESSANLQWVHYYCHRSGTFSSFFASLVSTYIVLFPAMDVASAFPLNAVTLGNSLLESYYGKVTEIEEARSSRRVINRFRLLAAAPPILGAALVPNLGALTSYTGCTGFIIAFVFPQLLSYSSKKLLLESNIEPHTHYSGWWSSTTFIVFSLVIGVSLFIFVSASLVVNGSAEG
jgi:hypothetical protein